VGTRPEAIKMAPVVHELGRHEQQIATFACATGQHRELLGHTLAILKNLAVMEPDQDLAGLTSRLFQRLDHVIRDWRPD
jgi:UDP-N-acetylglucosamine 2-epimerase (non-hydrolysing)